MLTPSSLAADAKLHALDDAAWLDLARKIHPQVHPVDQNALLIWNAFWPVTLADYVAAQPNQKLTIEKLKLRGRWRLAEVADTSHWFFYGHRYWAAMRTAAAAALPTWGTAAEGGVPLAGVSELEKLIQDLAVRAAQAASTTQDLTLAMAFVAVKTARLAGLGALQSTASVTHTESRTPDQVLAARAKDDGQGLAGLFRSQKVWSVIFDEKSKQGRYPLTQGASLTAASARDPRDFSGADSRCFAGDGVIPVECRSGACGFCWVGVVAGADKMAEPTDFERKRMKFFGYAQENDEKPLIRLACQCYPNGNCTIAIPEWNGAYGPFLAQNRLIE